MLNLVFFGVYMIVGWLVMMGATIIHITVAEMKGYDVGRWVDECRADQTSVERSISIVMEVLVWPAALVEFIMYDTKVLYEVYPRK